MKQFSNNTSLLCEIEDGCFFNDDFNAHKEELEAAVSKSRCLIVGGAGSIGAAVANELRKLGPKTLHLVDISENNLVEVVRQFRSSEDFSEMDFKTFALDFGSPNFKHFLYREGPYDFVFNLAALKHVRSERDPHTLLRMIRTNVINSVNLATETSVLGTERYFAVSSDKAEHPANAMGATKRLMEKFLLNKHDEQKILMARFANVAFSDGSLLHGFKQRFEKKQPISIPVDIKRYFLSQQESGKLCVLSALLGSDKEIFFPKQNSRLKLISFNDLLEEFLQARGYRVFQCESEEQARKEAKVKIQNGFWPCLYFNSDTSGEKESEEFFWPTDTVFFNKFSSIGVIEPKVPKLTRSFAAFQSQILELEESGQYCKEHLIDLLKGLVEDFGHSEKGKDLDQRM